MAQSRQDRKKAPQRLAAPNDEFSCTYPGAGRLYFCTPFGSLFPSEGYIIDFSYCCSSSSMQ
jgi:hypothetical protein